MLEDAVIGLLLFLGLARGLSDNTTKIDGSLLKERLDQSWKNNQSLRMWQSYTTGNASIHQICAVIGERPEF